MLSEVLGSFIREVEGSASWTLANSAVAPGRRSVTRLSWGYSLSFASMNVKKSHPSVYFTRPIRASYISIMGLIARMDNWTLIVCIALATSMSSFAFARTWKTHRSLRGSGSFAFAFFLAAVTCFIFALIPDNTPLLRFLNTPVGDTLALCVYALLLTGVERFFEVRRATVFGWILVLISFALTIYFTEFNNSIVARMVVNDLATCILRAVIAIELLRHAGRRHLRPLSAIMLAFAALSLALTWDTLVYGGPTSAHAWMNSRSHEQFSLFATLVFFIATGKLLLLMLNGELVLHLEDEAARDFMTGTLNRRGAERALIAEMGRSQRFGMALSVCLVDVDHFKQINDTRGHAEGDRILITVANTIESSLRAYDLVGRFGGDEFLIILPNTPAPDAFFVMERLRSQVAELTHGEISLSIGVTNMNRREIPEILLARVDGALYQAKEEGRNTTRLRIPDSEAAPVPAIALVPQNQAQA